MINVLKTIFFLRTLIDQFGFFHHIKYILCHLNIKLIIHTLSLKIQLRTVVLKERTYSSEGEKPLFWCQRWEEIEKHKVLEAVGDTGYRQKLLEKKGPAQIKTWFSFITWLYWKFQRNLFSSACSFQRLVDFYFQTLELRLVQQFRKLQA